MAFNSKIGWTQSSWNPWYGCHKISDGCKFCYMYRDLSRFGHDPSIVRRSKTTFFDPIKWKEPRLIFPCSWSDFFVEEADQWREEAWKIIKQTPQHTYQMLTKRIERVRDHLPPDWGNGYPNVWLGVSIESNKYLEDRIDYLSWIKAKVRWVSAEPLLHYLYFGFKRSKLKHIDWVVTGGESGFATGDYRYRECKIKWIESVVEQCQDARVPVFVKQLGTHLAKELNLSSIHGQDINEFPLHLRIQQYPN